jgi:transposase
MSWPTKCPGSHVEFHTARVTMDFLTPDLNPIEQFWDELDRRVRLVLETPLSAISWRPVLVVEEAGENHRPWASNW